MARISAEQVLTDDALAEAGIGLCEQQLVTKSAILSGAAHIYVEEGRIIPGTERPAGKPRATRKKRGRPAKRGRPRKPRQGGWRTTSYISHDLRKDTRRKASLLQRAGYPFTVFATVRPPAVMSDAEAKRYVGLQFARLGQALERKGHSYVGFISFEKKGGLLHGHMPLHARREQMPVVKSWAHRFDPIWPEPHERGASVERHARPYASSDIKYALKQHKPCGPGYEPLLKFYQKGEPFRGRRVSWTKKALAIIRQAEVDAATLVERLAVKAKPPTLRVVVSNPVVPEPVQLSLFASCEKPISRLAQFGGGVIPPAVAQEVEARRRWRGLTQQELADAIMVARPTLANAMQGRFPLSAWAATRLREFLLPPPTLRAA